MSDSNIRLGSPRDLVRKSTIDPSLAQGKVQPQANDVEEVVLGALMLDKDAISVVLDILQPESFYSDGNQAIYRAMLALFDKNTAIDLITVNDQLQRSGEIDKAGGPYRLVQLSNRVGSAANVEYHARIIAQKSIARDLIKASSEVLRDAYDETIDVFDLLDDAEKKIFKITEDKLSRGVESIAELGPKALRMLEEVRNRSDDGLTGVPTGFTDLDKITNGWQPSDLIVIAARPGMGKCLGMGTPVILYDGTRKAVEDVEVGDLLMGDDSTPRRVLSLARGRERMWWVRQSFGEDYRVNESHILTVRHADQRVEDLDLVELLSRGVEGLEAVKGFRVRVNYSARATTEDPYVLGRRLAEESFDCADDGEGAFAKTRVVVPDSYRLNRFAVRRTLLAGLIDGCIAAGVEHDVSTGKLALQLANAELASLLATLADELGLVVEGHSGHVVIAGELGELGAKLVRLNSDVRLAEHWGESKLTLEPDLVDDYYGFEIDGNRRFLLGDATVTHNTAFVLSIARNAAMDYRKGVAIFSLEMANVQLVQRLLSMEAQVDSKKMRSGKLGDEEWDRLQQGIERLSAAPIFIDDTPAINIFELRAKCRRLKMQHDIQLVIIDYLQLMSGSTGNGKGVNREQEISAISRNLKQLAKEVNVPVIALSQLSRAVEQRGGDKRPMLSDLRECVPGHTLVCLADGRRVPISALVGTQPEVISMQENGTFCNALADKVWPVGTKKTYRIVLASGRRIEATAEHRLYRFGAWATVAELEVGQRLDVARVLPQPKHEEHWDDEAVALLGQLIGDGSYLSGAPMRFTSNNEDNLACVEAGAKHFGCTTRRYDQATWSQLVIGGNGNRWQAAGVNQWLRELGIFGQRSHEKRIPERAFKLGNRQIALLLCHLWATDGTIHSRPEHVKGSHVIQYSTNSPGLATDVMALLLRLGIVARLRSNQKASFKPGYLVAITGRDQQMRFLDLIGGFGPRAAQAVQLRSRLAETVANTNTDTIPQEVFVQVKSRMSERGISQRAMAELRGTSYGGQAHFAFAPSRQTLAGYAEPLQDADLSALASNDLFWDEIQSIEPVGEQEVFDLTVPGPACWLADGIVSHNSGAIEQDADMVNFIYRPEYYDIDTDADGNSLKGVAKIIIAKNRHGELTDVQLKWIGDQARFDNWQSVDFNSFKPGIGGSPFASSGFGASSDEGSVTLQSRVNTDEDEILF